MSVTGHDQLKARRVLKVDGREYDYFSLDAAGKAAGLGDISRLPFSMKVLLENLVRLENGRTVTRSCGVARSTLYEALKAAR